MPWPTSSLTRDMLLEGIKNKERLEDIGKRAGLEGDSAKNRARQRLIAEGLHEDWKAARKAS